MPPARHLCNGIFRIVEIMVFDSRFTAFLSNVSRTCRRARYLMGTKQESDVRRDTESENRPHSRIEIDLERLSAGELLTMAAAGAEAVDCIRVLANTGDNLVGELLNGADGFYQWDHYPAGDVYDPASHAQYYYHAHPQELRSGEHGHFHTFLRAGGMPDNMRPVPLPDYEAPEAPNDDLTHIVAVSMNPHGIPTRLFVTNRWVTGETWYAAEDVCSVVDRFEIDHARPSWPVNRWISAMMVLFRPQVLALLRARDAGIARWASERPGTNIYEDRELEIVAALDISIDDQVAAIDEALRRREACGK